MKFLKIIQRNIKERRTRFILLLCTAALITASAIFFKTPIYRILPLYVSLFIMLYQSEANRFSFLAAAINSVFYSIVYFSLGIYASASSSLLISMPTSLITFFSWSRKPYKKSVVFKKMKTSGRILTIILSLLVWLGIFIFLKHTGAGFVILDNTSTVIGILVTFLTAFAYIEYSYVGLLHIAVSLALKTQLAINDISNLPFLIYTLYNAFCYSQIFINVRRLYREQNSKSENNEVREELS